MVSGDVIGLSEPVTEGKTTDIKLAIKFKRTEVPSDSDNSKVVSAHNIYNLAISFLPLNNSYILLKNLCSNLVMRNRQMSNTALFTCQHVECRIIYMPNVECCIIYMLHVECRIIHMPNVKCRVVYMPNVKSGIIYIPNVVCHKI